MYDYVICHGRVMDPASAMDAVTNVAIKGGRIAAIGNDITADQGQRTYDATGQLVIPGMIDIHTHVYEHVTPLGINVDEYCLRRGVTTAVDAGSAGYATLPGFRKFIAEQSITRVLALLNISSIGLASATLGGQRDMPGELEALTFASIDGAVPVIMDNRDLVVGVKIRLSASIAGEDGRHEAESYARALALAGQVGLPLMVHHSLSTVPLTECPGKLRPGDIYTHMYHGFQSSIVNPHTRRVDEAVWQAYEHGVLFDIGNGQGSFNWTVAEIAFAEGFAPHIISSDLHSGGVHGPTYDLATAMTRCLHIGMSLDEVIRAVTIAPARAIGWDDRIGTLDIGREADITVLSVDEVDLELEDCQSQRRRITRRIQARAVWRAGQYYPCTVPNPWPNPKSIARQRRSWDRLVVRDETAPK